MNRKSQPAYAPDFNRQIVELDASGRGLGDLAKAFGGSEASVHACLPMRSRPVRASIALSTQRNCGYLARDRDRGRSGPIATDLRR